MNQIIVVVKVINCLRAFAKIYNTLTETMYKINYVLLLIFKSDKYCRSRFDMQAEKK